MKPSEPSIGVFSTDVDLRVRSWNPWVARLSGVAPAAACGQPLAALLPDLEARGLLARFRHVLDDGVVEVLAPRLHHYLFPASPEKPSRWFDRMQQHVIIAPLIVDGHRAGTLVTIEDVTARLDRERELVEELASPDEERRLRAAHALAEEDTLYPDESLLVAADDPSWRVRQASVGGLLERRGGDTIASLLSALRKHHRNLGILNSIIQVLTTSGADTLASLLEFLIDPDPELRTYAALTLGAQADRRAIPGLMSGLDDPDPNVRYHVIEALGRIGAPEAVDALTAIVETRDFFQAFPALDALRNIGDRRAAARLVPVLADETLQASVVEALGQLGGEAEIPLLAGLLDQPGAPVSMIAQALADLYDRYGRVYAEGSLIADLARRAVTGTGACALIATLVEARETELRPLGLVLSWLEGPVVDEALAGLLARPGGRKEAVAALVRRGVRVTRYLCGRLEDEDVETRRAAVVALGQIGDLQALPRLRQLLKLDEDLIEVAAEALAKIGDREAFEPLLTLLGHPSAATRQAVIAAIDSIGHPHTSSRMIGLMADGDPVVRESAVKVAGYFGSPGCVDALLASCHDPDLHVRSAAVDQLPYLEDERALPLLLDSLRHEVPSVRAAAARGLAQVEDVASLWALIAALEDPDPWVRYFSARSLGRRVNTEALDALGRLAQKDAAPQVRAAAIAAVGQIGGARAVTLLAPLAEVDEADLSRAAIAALGTIAHPDAITPLVAALGSPETDRRIDALRALAEQGGNQAVDALQLLVMKHEHPQVVQMAIHALGHLGNREAVDTLVTLTSVPACRESCVEALGQLDEAKAAWVARGLSDERAVVRRAVVDALARMKCPRASEFLRAALDDTDLTVRLDAVTALGHLGNTLAERRLVAIAVADENPTLRQAARTALRR